MKVQKYEISRTIDKLKSIVQKNDQFPALGGVLVKDGYLIASNTEMTMQLKLEASKGSCFIIPMKAFDVIKNLPDGEVIIDADGKNIVTIKTKAIKNKYQSYPPEEFSFDITEDLDAPEVVINGKRMMEAKTMIEILDMKDVKDATPEELEELRRKGFLPKTRSKRISGKPLTPYERTRAQVAATGNRWAMENFYATHS